MVYKEYRVAIFFEVTLLQILYEYPIDMDCVQYHYQNGCVVFNVRSDADS
jgi:hypothetical protein